MKTLTSLILSLLPTSVLFGQEINLGFMESIHSKVLNENREIIINLPKEYNEAKKSYPVIYRLDGDIDLCSETIGIINRLTYIDESIQEMIVVMIKNTDRNRDMMPAKTNFFDTKPGAENFEKFIDNELMPHIDNSYRTTGENILCEQSLSAVFSLFHFLTSTALSTHILFAVEDFLIAKNILIT